jgi:hypothetical protein
LPVAACPPGLAPYRGTFGERRAPELAGLALPPCPMPARQGTRPLKAWRYVGVFAPEIMLCLAQVRVGPARQSFWAVWDRPRRRLYEHTELGTGGVDLQIGAARLRRGVVRIELELAEAPGVEVVCPSGESYAWTRKQGGIPARVRAEIEGTRAEIDARAVIDDTAAYYPRHTHWRWCAGVGRSDDGRALAWNLVSGVNDPPSRSERTVWVDGEPHEVPACGFSDDLTRIDALRFRSEATLARRQSLVLLRSSYRQPFGSFSGQLPGGVELAEGYGVVEEHDAWW